MEDIIVLSKTLRLFWVGVIALVLVAGCISKPDAMINADIPSPTIFSPTPLQLYIKAGHSEEAAYKDHIITINYSSAYPIQIVRITLDGIEKTIYKETGERPGGIYWREKNLSFTLKPVVWETRDSQQIPFYEKTWNTTELYFEVIGE